MSEPLLEVKLQAGYARQTVLKDIQFSIERSERLGLAGISGAGKSTLILALMGLLKWRQGWVKGEVLFEGKNLLAMRDGELRRVRGKRIALVPQSPMNALNSALSLKRHFDEAWKAHEAKSRPKLAHRLQTLLAQVQLPTDEKFLLRKPSEISVGQAQRILIALALLHRPALLIADEPTSALDPHNQIEILNLLHAANGHDGTALLYISHDLMSVLQLCESLAVLHEGAIVERLAVAEIERCASHEASLALLRTLPVPAHMIYSFARQRMTGEDREAVRATIDAEPSDQPAREAACAGKPCGLAI